MSTIDDFARNTPMALSRRNVLVGAGALAATAALPSRAAAADVIKIGYVSPRSGGMASVVATDGFMLDQVRAALKSGLTVGDKTYEVQILDRDTQSDPKRAADLTKSLITQDQVDLVLSSFTPETVNPVADVCEGAEVPGLFNVCPWEAFYFARGAKPGQPSPFKWTYIFSFGVAEFAKSFLSQWIQIPTNKKVGVLYPGDPDGNALRHALIPMLQNGGFTVIDPGPFDDGSADFTAQIALFQKEQCEILNSFMIPPDSPVFLRQAALAGLTKQIKICQVAKAGLVPGDIAAMGSLGYRITTGNYWHRAFPYKSSLTGQEAGALADAYEKASGAQVLPQLGAGLALFDVAAEALKAAGTPKDKAALAKAIAALDVTTVDGRVNFRGGPVPNVAVMPTLGVQYVKAKQGPFKLDAILIDNTGDTNVPVQGKMVPYSS
jgi:branched-chain amino acid transport system substrate-binding protein